MVAAAKTVPTGRDVLILIATLVAVIVLVLPLGLVTGFFRWSPLPCNWRVLLMGFRTLISPALLEEMWWRAFFLPHRSVDGDAAIFDCWESMVLVLFAFVLAHVLSGYLLTRFSISPGAWNTFTSPFFLFLAAVVGIACTVAYVASGGSLWMATLMHALPIYAWLSLLGGEERLRGPQATEKGGESVSSETLVTRDGFNTSREATEMSEEYESYDCDDSYEESQDLLFSSSRSKGAKDARRFPCLCSPYPSDSGSTCSQDDRADNDEL